MAMNTEVVTRNAPHPTPPRTLRRGSIEEEEEEVDPGLDWWSYPILRKRESKGWYYSLYTGFCILCITFASMLSTNR